MALRGTQLASAIAYAEAEGWLADTQEQAGFPSLVRVRSSPGKKWLADPRIFPR